MVFKVIKEKEIKPECVAYLTYSGALFIKDRHGGHCVGLFGDDSCGLADWEPERATQKFYPGDEITITF